MTHHNPRLKIGIDLHGVITANPDYFSRFTHFAKDKGFEIYILTGASAPDAKAELQHYNIVYDHLFSISDYFRAKGQITELPGGHFHVEDKLWDAAKANYSNQNHIHFHIDDKEQYGVGMQAVFCHYKHHEQKCTINGTHDFHLSQDLASVFALIEKIIKDHHKL